MNIDTFEKAKKIVERLMKDQAGVYFDDEIEQAIEFIKSMNSENDLIVWDIQKRLKAFEAK